MAMRKISTGTIMAIAMLGLVLTFTTAGVLSVNQTIPATGNIIVQTPAPTSPPSSPSASPSPPPTVSLGVYSDSACTQNLTSIDWGTLSPGGSVTRTIYVKNTGNTQITLSMTPANWNPASANGPITLTWNREGTTLSAGQSTSATLTLSVSSSISGITSFSVNIVISGTG